MCVYVYTGFKHMRNVFVIAPHNGKSCVLFRIVDYKYFN